jgi:hypothetical protein
VTLLSWDIAGDQGGWFKALWVPILGVVIAMSIWVWDRVLTLGVISEGDWSTHFFSIYFPSLHSKSNRHSESMVTPLEIVHCSLHQRPPSLLESVPEVLDEESVADQFAL